MAVDWKEILKSLKDEAVPKRWDMNELTRNFFEGLFLLVPVVVTVVVVLKLFEIIDGWLNIPIPGLGFVITLLLITLAGRLASNVFFRGALGSFEKLLTRTPFIKLVYTSLKDLIEAFMGEKKRFDQPVMVSLVPGGHAEAIGFVTRKSMDMFGQPDHVAVYFPQSYNFAGNLLVFPKDQVRPIDAESSEVMAFIVSGGVSGRANNGSESDSSSPDPIPALPPPGDSPDPSR
ncbi:DUF502 domain-containing protein [Candidatus Nitronereus thalassa]|uniref:DUF502 domain-containing protein n=1 Tax=Candidatus Nitronereus thalassa TaxID=3020898 RepID=A0ABU3K8G6_9BACT|nr:DUF502 domain-containing protein [Candidatus Nitronereus thalassa]MDT7042694.1 DUF502 domain-containing protein [Candidatus Nitronereus thalassa]